MQGAHLTKGRFAILAVGNKCGIAEAEQINLQICIPDALLDLPFVIQFTQPQLDPLV